MSRHEYNQNTGGRVILAGPSFQGQYSTDVRILRLKIHIIDIIQIHSIAQFNRIKDLHVGLILYFGSVLQYVMHCKFIKGKM